jgi:hypothetical protein
MLEFNILFTLSYLQAFSYDRLNRNRVADIVACGVYAICYHHFPLWHAESE